MKYNPKLHHRRSIRKKDHNYGKEGFYFITILCKRRAHLFGLIINKSMILNKAGLIARQCWMDIPDHFPQAILHAFVIMPDHIHGIIELTDIDMNCMLHQKSGLPRGTSKSIGSIVRGFKIGVTKWMRKNSNVQHVWHRNYYEHIIRDEKAYQNISRYIRTNPERWRKHDK
jgi:REP element-mobilizing transposase RayT